MRGKPTIVKTIRLDPDEVDRIMKTLIGWRYRYDWTAVVVGALKDAMDTALRERAEVPKLYQQIAEATDLELLPTEPFDLGEPEPEPEPVQVAEPEPEPVQVAEPEPEPVQVAEPTKAKAKAKAKPTSAKAKAKPTSAKAKAKPTSAKPTSAKVAKAAPSKNGTVKKGGKR